MTTLRLSDVAKLKMINVGEINAREFKSFIDLLASQPQEEDEGIKISICVCLTVNANRILLAKNSDYFRKMFESSFKEKEMKEIYLEEIDPYHLLKFIDFIEGKEQSGEIDPNEIVRLIRLADRLQSPSFREYHMMQLLDNLDLDQLGELLEIDPDLALDFVTRQKKEQAAALSATIRLLIQTISARDDIDESEKEQRMLLLKKALVSFINAQQVPFASIAKTDELEATIQWLLPALPDLRYANFKNFCPTAPKIDNDQFKQIIRSCPNLTRLFINSTILRR